MKEPTKADLAAAVAKLTEENAGMRDLLAAVSECARTVPLAAAGEPSYKERSRATSVLTRISVVTDPGSTWEWSWGSGQGAAHLRELAAEPPGYEVYVEPEPPAGPGGVPFPAGSDEDGPMDDEAELRRADAVREPACCGSERKLFGGPLYQCELPLGHEGLHSVLTPTGVFIAEWSNDPSAGVHTPSGYQPAGVTA